MKHNICPSCKKRISFSWKAWWRFTNGIGGIGFRRPAPCPHCGTMLVYAKWFWRISSSGVIFLLTSLVLTHPILQGKFDGLVKYSLYLALLLILIASPLQKFEEITGDKKKEKMDQIINSNNNKEK